ncbi:hypothetical protein BZG02_20435 [Labilibaculum filiforme]|uniref:Uncharacterized protein n=1 Tax=Labilibaculum filiforme TaxID=1940526 RepID=A0A2N3HQ54_9BACT|nr:hypothetical protein BZG02_20435 [Labilibaculum filiforme]
MTKCSFLSFFQAKEPLLYALLVPRGCKEKKEIIWKGLKKQAVKNVVSWIKPQSLHVSMEKQSHTILFIVRGVIIHS